jgi:hypothetical protein
MTTNSRWLLIGLAAVVALCACLACAGLVAYLVLQPMSVRQGSTESEFRGYYTSGFEVSSFVPCASGDVPGYGAGYWLNSEPESGFYDQYSQLSQSVNPPPGGYVTVFTRFRARLSPPGSYGHLGAYSHEITVTEVLEMSLDGTC